MTHAFRLADLARQVGRLRPDWRDHERYFEERDGIERALRALSRELKEGAGRG